MTQKLKTAVMAMVVAFIFVAVPQNVFAQDPLKKHLEKEYKSKLKEYKKAGFKILSDRSMEVCLLKHFGKLNADEDQKTITGVVKKCKSTNVCKQSALNNAQNEYARLVSGKIQGAFASIIKANANRPQEEIDKMTGGLLNEVEANVAGVLIPSYSIYKELSDGTQEFRTIFFIDSEKTNAMLENVFERSIKETKLTIEEAKSIQKFVKDELKNETSSEPAAE